MFDIAERAGACAHIAQHQKCRGAASPAFAQIRAHGFFANGVQLFRAHQRPEAIRTSSPEGARTLIHSGRRSGRMSVSGMTRSLVGVAGIRSFLAAQATVLGGNSSAEDSAECRFILSS